MKCFCCKKKSTILLECKCKNQFCIKHILAENHECQFDYYTYHKELLQKNNPRVIASKVKII